MKSPRISPRTRAGLLSLMHRSELSVPFSFWAIKPGVLSLSSVLDGKAASSDSCLVEFVLHLLLLCGVFLFHNASGSLLLWYIALAAINVLQQRIRMRAIGMQKACMVVLDETLVRYIFRNQSVSTVTVSAEDELPGWGSSRRL